MKTVSQLWFFLPHALSSACFAAAFAWMWHVGTNRTEPDRLLGYAGFIVLALALLASIIAAIALINGGLRRTWPWLLAHVAGLVVPLALASGWLGAHIA
ncbi:MAG: hypothetical protein H6842_08275 [Rhodospirillaceae bacterium]|nr:hypothetical protein [Rhodospirillaceae bacterium]